MNSLLTNHEEMCKIEFRCSDIIKYKILTQLKSARISLGALGRRLPFILLSLSSTTGTAWRAYSTYCDGGYDTVILNTAKSYLPFLRSKYDAALITITHPIAQDEDITRAIQRTIAKPRGVSEPLAVGDNAIFTCGCGKGIYIVTHSPEYIFEVIVYPQVFTWPERFWRWGQLLRHNSTACKSVKLVKYKETIMPKEETPEWHLVSELYQEEKWLLQSNFYANSAWQVFTSQDKGGLTLGTTFNSVLEHTKRDPWRPVANWDYDLLQMPTNLLVVLWLRRILGTFFLRVHLVNQAGVPYFLYTLDIRAKDDRGLFKAVRLEPVVASDVAKYRNRYALWVQEHLNITLWAPLSFGWPRDWKIKWKLVDTIPKASLFEHWDEIVTLANDTTTKLPILTLSPNLEQSKTKPLWQYCLGSYLYLTFKSWWFSHHYPEWVTEHYYREVEDEDTDS